MSFKINPPNFALIQDVDKKMPARGGIDLTGLLPPKRKPKSKIGTPIVTHELLEEFARQKINGVSFLFNNDEVVLIDKAHGSVTLTKKDNKWWGTINNVSFEIGNDFDVTFWYKDQDSTSVQLCGPSDDDDMNDAIDPFTIKR